jgi:hypothetical protein
MSIQVYFKSVEKKKKDNFVTRFVTYTLQYDSSIVNEVNDLLGSF